ncbi:shikimate kinase [Virgibacillus flavescens]|uniref:shikimate kinase n=1 Tax=Virgibacillus flavescens TaxID=1611422 RepID=UPI003D329762
MTNIYLIGFMGSGKSSVGKHLSGLLELAFVDTDLLIKDQTNKKIADIFALEGESKFREYETEALASLPTKSCVVATGGGIVETPANVEQMKKSGKIVLLDTSFLTISERLEADRTRPLWNQKKSSQKKLYVKRMELYRTFANIIVSTDGQSIEHIANEIRSRLENE